MTSRVYIRDVDRGYRAAMRAMMPGTLLVVEVGVLGPKAAARKRGSTTLTVGDVAAFHEHAEEGGTLPRRSIVGDWFDENEQVNKDLARRLGKQRAIGRMSYEQSLKMMGVHAEGGMKARLSKGIKPALKPATVKRKGSSKPLIDQGQLRASISSRVVKP